jgi:hypothetical protein
MSKLAAILMLTVLLLSISSVSSVTYVKVSAVIQPPATEPKPNCPTGSSLEVLNGHWHCTPLEYHP